MINTKKRKKGEKIRKKICERMCVVLLNGFLVITENLQKNSGTDVTKRQMKIEKQKLIKLNSNRII